MERVSAVCQIKVRFPIRTCRRWDRGAEKEMPYISEDGYIPEAYAALEESFIYSTEMNPRLIELPKELMALRFADRIKEAIKKYTPEYYNFLYYYLNDL